MIIELHCKITKNIYSLPINKLKKGKKKSNSTFSLDHEGAATWLRRTKHILFNCFPVAFFFHVRSDQIREGDSCWWCIGSCLFYSHHIFFLLVLSFYTHVELCITCFYHLYITTIIPKLAPITFSLSPLFHHPLKQSSISYLRTKWLTP